MSKQALADSRTLGWSYITHEAMQALQAYFGRTPKASLSSGIALYMSIAYLLSVELRDGRHQNAIEKTREEIGEVGGLSATSVTRYADHLVRALVLELEQQATGGANLYLWRLIDAPHQIGEAVHADLHSGGEPLHSGEAPYQDGEAPHHGDKAPLHSGEAYIDRRSTKKTDKKTPCSPPGGDGDPDAVVEVYEYWRKVAGKNDQTVLSPKRRRAIVKLLREGMSVARLQRAIAGNQRSDYHQKRGKYANRDGPVHDELTLILRDPEHVEMFEQLSPLQVVDGDLPELAGLVDVEMAKARWGTAREKLKASITQSTYNLWVEPFECVGVRKGTRSIVLLDTTGSGGLKAWAERRYSALMIQALDGAYDAVEFVDEKQLELEAA